MDKKEKLLIIIPFIPYPLNTGGNQGSFNALNFIKDYFDVHIWFHINNEKKSLPLIREFERALDGKVHVHYTANHIGRNYVTYRAINRVVRNKFLKKDIQHTHNKNIWGQVDEGYCDVRSLEDICQIIKDNDIRFVQIEYASIMDVVYALPHSVKTIFIHHELAFVRKETMANQLAKKFVFDDYRRRKLLAEEITALNQYDAIISMSEIDKDKLIESGVIKPIYPSPSFIPKCRQSYPDFKVATNTLSYIASAGHSPNVEGLRWFIDNVHPLLAKEVDYRLYVIGSNWDKVLVGALPENIVLKGFVEDLADVVPGTVMIVPILSGSGMRMKILESVNNSVPFVSTSVGAEGLKFIDSVDCFITDDPAKFCEDVVKLLNKPTLQKEFVEKSRVVYENNYAPKILANRRLEILNHLIND